MMIFTRSLSGMLSGNVAVVKASLGEITVRSSTSFVKRRPLIALFGSRRTIPTKLSYFLSTAFAVRPPGFHLYILPCFDTAVSLLPQPQGSLVRPCLLE